MNDPSALEQLKQRLDALESKDDIRALVTAYGVACDEHDLHRLVDLFTEDAEFTAPNGAMAALGRQAIEEMYINTFRIRGPSYHWTHDVVIDISPDNPDRATGLVLSHAETSPDGVVSIAAMRYADEYQRGSDRVWRFARREITFLYYTPVTEFSSVLNNLERVTMGGAKHPADFPERLDVWKEFSNNYSHDNSETKEASRDD